jgi:hypothetical protein
MLYEVHGTDVTTGQHRTVIVEADDAGEAMTEAERQGVRPKSVKVGEPGSGAAPRPAPRRLASALLGAGIVLALAAVIGAITLSLRDDSRGGRPATGPEAARPDYSVTAQQLYTDYVTNAAHAQEVYGGKLVQITGRLGESGQDAVGHYVTFIVSPPGRRHGISDDPADAWRHIAEVSATVGTKRVRCYLTSKATFRPDQEASVIGRCVGMAGDLTLKEGRSVTGISSAGSAK